MAEVSNNDQLKKEDLNEFDTQIHNLFKHSKIILELQNKLKHSDNNLILANLTRYIKAYNKTPCEQHVEFFRAIYHPYRRAILKGLEVKDENFWLKNNSVSVQYGKTLNKELPEGKKIRIHLKSIYTSALYIQEITEKSLSGLSEDAYENRSELSLADYFILYLYKIFHCIAPSDDRSTLKSIIHSIEDELGISNEDVSNNTSNNTSNNSNTNNTNNLTNILSPVMSMASNLLKNSGIGNDMPANTRIPSEKELLNVTNSILTNKSLQEGFSDIINDVKGCNNVNDLIIKLTSSLNNPKLINPISEVINVSPSELSSKIQQLQSVGPNVIPSLMSSMGIDPNNILQNNTQQ